MPASHKKNDPNQATTTSERSSQSTSLGEPRPAQQACRFCADAMAPLDAQTSHAFESRTLQCETCGECYLHVRRGNESVLVHLRDFLEKRGDAPEQRPLRDRTMAENLITAMVSDEWPSPATCMDFGLDSRHQYKAMQEAVREQLTAYELDRVLGDGKAITQLVAFARPDKQLCTVEFSTPWDDMPDEPPSADEPRMHRKLRTKPTLDL